MTRTLHSAACALTLIAVFAALMTVGYQLRHGEWIWEALTHV